MTDHHPITPPPELVTSWIECDGGGQNAIRRIAARAAQWGADQELEACCEWLMYEYDRQGLREARRPKPPSLVDEALELAQPAGTEGAHVTFGPDELATIRRALERLQELEGVG